MFDSAQRIRNLEDEVERLKEILSRLSRCHQRIAAGQCDGDCVACVSKKNECEVCTAPLSQSGVCTVTARHVQMAELREVKSA